MNRRDFTRLSAAGVWALPAFCASAGTWDYAWNLGIITDQVDLDLTRVLNSFYTKYQLRWAEIRDLQLDGKKRYVYADATRAQLKQVKRQLDDARVRSCRFSTRLSIKLLCPAPFRLARPLPTLIRNSVNSPGKWTISSGRRIQRTRLAPNEFASSPSGV